MTTKRPLETAATAGLSGSDSGAREPNQETGSPTKREKEAPVAKRREEYSTKSAEAQEKGKEVDKDWYSFTGC